MLQERRQRSFVDRSTAVFLVIHTAPTRGVQVQSAVYRDAGPTASAVIGRPIDTRQRVVVRFGTAVRHDGYMTASMDFAAVLAAEFARGGVRECVVCPGERSGPIALAFARHPQIRVHVRIDERTAAFLALGLAVGSGRPVPVVCTSGTATANLYPALVEASRAEVGVIALTADRPPEQRYSGVNQTIDQLDMFPAARPAFLELGSPASAAREAGYWSAMACLALTRARKGPVQFNIPLRELAGENEAAGEQEITATRTVVEEPACAVLRPRLRLPARGIVLAGAGRYDREAVRQFARESGWPVFAEATSGLRGDAAVVPSHGYLLAVPSVLERLAPAAVLTVGRVTLPRWVRPLTSMRTRHFVVADGDGSYQVHAGGIERVLPGVPEPDGEREPEWQSGWDAADAASQRVIDRVLAEEPTSEQAIVRRLLCMAPAGSMAFIAASMPIHHTSLLTPRRADLDLFANRGVAGIDGQVSSAIGAALASPSRRAYALLGDLAFLHDQSGLVIGPAEPAPDLQMIVLNNYGGEVFSLLYPGRSTEYNRIFATQHHVDLGRIVTANGYHHHVITEATDLGFEDSAAGLRVTEFRSEQGAATATHQRLQQAITEAAG